MSNTMAAVLCMYKIEPRMKIVSENCMQLRSCFAPPLGELK